MIIIVLVAATAVLGYGLACYLRAAAKGQGARWRRTFMTAWRS